MNISNRWETIAAIILVLIVIGYAISSINTDNKNREKWSDVKGYEVRTHIDLTK